MNKRPDNILTFDPTRGRPKTTTERSALRSEQKKAKLENGLQKLEREYFMLVPSVVDEMWKYHQQLSKFEDSNPFKPVPLKGEYQNLWNMFEAWMNKLQEINNTARVMFSELQDYADALEGEIELKEKLETYKQFADLPNIMFRVDQLDRVNMLPELWGYVTRIRSNILSRE